MGLSNLGKQIRQPVDFGLQKKPVGDIVTDITGLFNNTTKSVEGTKEYVDKLNKNFDLAFPYMIIGAVLLGITLITQSSKNVQEIVINNKKLK